jgi:acyl-CoA synthetase (AMP-forming)/AMP-acid ligase II
LRLDCDLLLLDAGTGEENIQELGADHQVDVVIDPDREAEPTRVGRQEKGRPLSCFGTGVVTLLTSGSTGRPKLVCHDWHSLTRPVRRTKGPNRQCWLLTYRPHLYAGLQVFFHCLLNQETLVVPEPGLSVAGLLSLMHRAGATAVSATPSYMRRLVMLGRSDDLRRIPLQQITLGGEIADQATLDALRRLYPQVRLVHIYATSELGRCFSVKDGQAGFPAGFLDVPSDEGVQLKVVDGELHVRSANAMRGLRQLQQQACPENDWVATGDLVERVDDRYCFVGRRNEMINVGGNKVQPLRVEAVIQLVPGVHDVRVFARHSSLVGQMVVCEFVTETGFEVEQVKQSILETCLKRLESYERPRFIQAVPSIPLSNAGKKLRQPS